MKAQTIWVLISGLAVGFLIGREWPRGGGGVADKDGTKAVAVQNAPAGPIPADWIKEDSFRADVKSKFDGLTAGQKYSVLKALNGAKCDCGGCNDSSMAKCLKDDPSCPRGPAVADMLIAAAKAGKDEAGVAAAWTKQAAPDKPAQAPPSQFQKAELAKWTPIEGPKLAKVTIVLFSDFQ